MGPTPGPIGGGGRAASLGLTRHSQAARHPPAPLSVRNVTGLPRLSDEQTTSPSCSCRLPTVVRRKPRRARKEASAATGSFEIPVTDLQGITSPVDPAAEVPLASPFRGTWSRLSRIGRSSAKDLESVFGDETGCLFLPMVVSSGVKQWE